mgnify:CR=1 FL=1
MKSASRIYGVKESKLSQSKGSNRTQWDLPPEIAAARIEAIRTVANLESTRAVHDVSDGGLLVTLAEMVNDDGGIEATVPTASALFSEAPGRVVVETTDRAALEAAVGSAIGVEDLGTATAVGELTVTVEAAAEEIEYDAETIREFRSTLEALG